MLTLVFGRQSTPYVKTRPRPARLCISSAVVNHSVNACVASELICNSNCNSFAKSTPMGRATWSNFCDKLKSILLRLHSI